VILSQTIQATRSPSNVLSQLLRIGRHAIVSLPNFGHWRIRLALLFAGRMPQTRALDHAWHETPNIHLCTIADFVALARETGAVIERAIALGETGHTHPMKPDAWGPNIFAEGAIFLLRPR
jgi:methionine biosynthesis protein MetW